MKKTLLLSLEDFSAVGGVANYYNNLTSNLPKEEIFCFTGRDNLLFKYFVWPKWLKGLFLAIKLIKSRRIEIIWAGQILPLGTIGLIIKKFYNIPYFVSCHGLDLLIVRNNGRKIKLIKKILINAEFITVNSHYTFSLVRGFGIDEKKIKIIYPCANIKTEIDQNRLAEYKNRYNPAGKKIILSVGRLIRRKGFQEVIKALPKILRKLENVLYIIIGQGEEGENLRKLIAQYNLNGNVLILNNITNHDLPYFYQLSDVFVMPTLISEIDAEGFGIVYLEAGWFKKPLIASGNGGTAEAVINGQSGIIVDPLNQATLTEALLKIFTDLELAQRLGRGNFVQAQKFSWSNEAKKLENLLI
jgi:phosphatidyl-myo-inositol dimannoside synthase